jgi:hypothetical protein
MKLVSLVLGGTFLVAGLLKVAHTATFADEIYSYRLPFLPNGLIYPIAAVLPWLEVDLGAVMIVGFWRESCAILLGSLSLLWSGAVTWALWRHLNIHCGCYPGSGKVAAGHLFLNLVLVILAILAGKSKTIQSPPTPSGNEK